MTWSRELAAEAIELLGLPWRGRRSQRARTLLSRALAEIARLRQDNDRLQAELDRAIFAGAVLGQGGNLGPAE